MSFGTAKPRSLVTVLETQVFKEEIRKERKWKAIHRNFNNELRMKLCDIKEPLSAKGSEKDSPKFTGSKFNGTPTYNGAHKGAHIGPGPQTTSQEIGWLLSASPLMESFPDRRLNYRRKCTDVTKLMETPGAWGRLHDYHLSQKSIGVRWK